MITALELFGRYPAPINERAMVLRDKLFELLPGIIEMPDETARVIGYGYGKGYKDNICTIIPSQKGLKPGFYKGASLADPQGLLEGTGKVHKYVAVDSVEQIHNPYLEKMLRAALERHQQQK